MKLRLLALCLPLMLAGCTPTATNPATLAPPVASGYVDNWDQQFAQDIAAAETFYSDQKTAIEAGKYVPAPTELTALNALGVAINVAKGAAQQYKLAQTSANLTAAQNAVNSATSQSKALQAVK